MALYRAQPRRRRRFPWVPTAVAVAVVGIGFGLLYWGTRGPDGPAESAAPAAGPTGLLTAGGPLAPALPTSADGMHDTAAPEAEVAAADPPGSPDDQPPDEILEPRPASAPTVAQRPMVSEDEQPEPGTPGENAAIAAARRRYESGKVLEARQELNTLLQRKLSPAAQAEVRRLLTRIGDDTIFSKQRLADDPLTETYTVQAGEMLINIGRRYHVPPEVIMRTNGIKDARRIHAQQEIKVPRGPFHLKIHKSQFRVDVYLQDLYVRSFPVGLGANASTPEGVWRVRNRLPNPTFYPPPSAEDKRIIAADDPSNPLGEHWIGLEYIEGDAVDTEKYGIHGTIDPGSIGKNISLGCVRMLNEDVALVYDLVLPGRSTVTILP
jgi:lipoprotein-anchoring transpeptidase ErfK/SrfK